MNHWILRLASLIVAIGLLVGCAPENNEVTPTDPPAETETQEIVVITISKDKGEEVITEKKVAINEGDLLLDVMKESFDIEEDGGFITSIDGLEQDSEAGIGWLYEVNNEFAEVGAAELELSADDKVDFDYQAWE